MLHSLLTRTWLWLSWLNRAQVFTHITNGTPMVMDVSELFNWLSDILKIDEYDYHYTDYAGL